MIKRLITVTALIALLLSACGAQGQEPSATPAPAVTETSVVAPTTAPATEPPAAAEATVPPATEAVATISPTAEVPRPTNAPGCTNSASFVADVTIPDKTEVEGGATFVKTWRIANTGTCIWGPDYTLIYYSDERMGAPASVPIPLTFPGQTADISLSLTAPTAPKQYQGNFVIKNPEGLIMKINDDSRLWVIILVKSAAATTQPPTATQGAAPVVQPTNTTASTTGGTGLVTASCAYSIDQSKMLQVINAVNAYRSQSGLPNYKVNSQLAAAAQSHAADMACNNLTGHTGSNKSTVESRVKASGYTSSFRTENVYFANPPGTGQDAVNWWINDQTDTRHRLNLVSDTYIDIGVGYAFFNNMGYYVIVFATP